MADTPFIDRQTPIPASWLNDVNTTTYGVVNVQHYGAVGDGITDNTVAFATAFALVASGGSLYIPKGTYVIPAFFDYTASNLIVFGDGDATVLKTTDTTTNNRHIFKLTGNNNNVRDLKIDGQKSNLSTVAITFRDGVYLHGDENTVERVSVINTTSSGIRVQNGSAAGDGANCAVLNCRVADTGTVYANNNAFGIIAAYIVGLRILGNKINNTVAAGIFTWGCTHQTIADNILDGTENGIRTQPVNTTPTGGDTYASITGNVIRNGRGDGIRFTGNYNSVCGNVITDSTLAGSGLFSQGGHHQTIVGNTVYGCSGNSGLAISNSSGNPADTINISGNNFSGCAIGVNLDPDPSFPITNVSISNNILLDNTYSLQLRDGGTANTAWLSGNVCDGIMSIDYSAWTLSNGNRQGPNIAAASAITLGGFDTYGITGTADINTIAGHSNGDEISLYFTGTAATNGVVDSTSIRLQGNFAYYFGATLKLLKVAGVWFEVSRSLP